VSDKKDPPRASKSAEQQYDVSHRGDTAGSGGPAGVPGAQDKSVIEGVGGTGGSSGAGAARAVTGEPGDVSGIDAPTPKPRAVSGTVPDYKQDLSDGGLPGKTRGPASETIPNADDDLPDEGPKRSQTT
jgi:hypothetical protein